ncbi:class I-like SAM-binding methyltransferase superfamily protein [Abortiporus biennis]
MSFSATLPIRSPKLPPSSKAWLTRQFKDPLVKERLSNPNNYRARSAFKLIELDQTWRFFKHNDVKSVVDLGAAPGGWSQVVAGRLGWVDDSLRVKRERWEDKEADSDEEDERFWEEDDVTETTNPHSGFKPPKGLPWSKSPKRIQPDPLDILDDPYLRMPPKSRTSEDDSLLLSRKGRGTIVAVDLLPMAPIRGVKTLQMDFLSSEADEAISNLLASEPGVPGKADVVLSDMAANFTGNRTHDVEASLDISNAVLEFCYRHLRTSEDIGRTRGGVLLLKHFAHPLLDRFRKEKLVPNFRIVKYIKPDSSRSESAEGYFVCLGWHPQDN